ncbi:PREDICTED: lethal(2) giant larvae protein homolog 1-like [Priapulus caudatus]|uniref:Lethal(2) giant larvae protein homolog 1-like n=1 Tax=Priapulus caudatus TaxID=37621 RepID=A0ABM1DVZ2_PRICU|nr:PREDICTED: lethal(2) giant larvae protein homolog 1-like [Priapulus caudatus]
MAQDLESICWVRGGEKFVCTYADGSYIIWTLEDGVKSLQTATTPYGPFPCKPITKVDYKTAPGDAFLIFAGGMPRASYGDRHTVTVMRGDKHVAFEFTSKFVDCLVLSSGDADAEHDDPHTLVVLADEEVVLIDLETDGWPTFKLPYLQSPHASAIMCTTHCSNVPEALWNNIAAAGEKQGSIHSPRDWPITGGKSLNEEVTKRELLLTGHEDGVVRFWDVSGIAMKLLYKLNTAPFFLSEHENQQDHDEEWPPFRKVGTFDPYSDDPRLGIQKISLCLANAILAVGGTAGQVVLLEMSMEEKEKELHEIYVQIIDRDNFVWKGHEPLTPKDGPLKLAAGCQPLTVMQMTPPAACTALALSSEYGLVAAGTAHGLTLFDYVQKKEVLSRCTLEAGAGEAGTPKRKNFRKSLRESFRRLRKVRLRKAPAAEDAAAGEEKRAKKEKKEKEKKEEKVSEVKEKKEETKEETKPEEKKEEEKKDEDKKEETKEAEPASVEPAEETETQASTETAEVTAEEAPATTTADEKKGEEVEEAKQKDEEKKEEEGEKKEEATEEATKPEEPKPESSKVEEEARPKSPEKTEAREDEGMPSVVRCLCITRTFLVNGTTNTPTLWAGTGSGAIYIYTVTIPNAEQRKEEAVSAQLGKEIQLKHKAAVMAIQVIDSANYPLPDTAAASKNIAKEPNMDGNHKVIICSMEQFKVFHLPSLKPYCKYKLVSHHSSLVRRIGFVKYTSSKNEEYSEWCLTCMSQLGELSIYSIPQLRKQILKPCTSKDDIHGIGSTVFTQDGEGMYLSSASEFVRFSLCPHMVTDATCVLELAEGMRPPPPQPKPEVTVETEEAAKVKGKVEAAEAPAAEEKKEEAKEEEGKAEPEKEGEAEEKTEEGEKPVDESTPGEMTGDITQDSITDHIADEEKATEDKAKEIESTAVEVKKIEDGGANEAPPVTAGGDQ